MDREIAYWVAFSCIPGIGRVRLGQLESHFGSLKDAWNAGHAGFRQAGLDEATCRAIEHWRPRIDPEEKIAEMSRLGIQALIVKDSAYPRRLKEIHDFPPVLYMLGELKPEDEWCLTVVGTRRATIYGRQVTEELVSDLVRNRITIVSGLARGIDTIAHRSALDAGGRTIAVLASGLDIIYPAENAGLAREIVKNGALLSEHPPGTRPRAEYFPRRNRILSGLSMGVLVTEAGEDSGALITARLALEQNREVFAVPGSILSPSSMGTNHLIQQGEAKLVYRCNDILEELNLTAVARQIEMREILPESATEAVILRELSAEPMHIDEICRRSGLSIAQVSSTLAMMELKGIIKQFGTMNYALAREARREYQIEAGEKL